MEQHDAASESVQRRFAENVPGAKVAPLAFARMQHGGMFIGLRHAVPLAEQQQRGERRYGKRCSDEENGTRGPIMRECAQNRGSAGGTQRGVAAVNAKPFAV